VTALQDATSPATPTDVQFLWLELTNVCNLQCVHCYAESSPFRAGDDLLPPEDYNDVLSTVAEFGCRKVQFIGGEPTLNRNLPDFIARARSLDYEFVEVFTNLIRLPSPLLDCFVEHKVHVATSAYSNDPRVHDEITKKPGSFRQTMRNIDTVLAAGLPLRAGVITMPLNENMSRTRSLSFERRV
jgi:MoaA/NifB/PqqE/SkfB family radical SAM enzyme